MNIELICEKYNITNYTVNDDGTIDVNGDVFLSNNDLVELPLTFNRVDGFFDCANNKLTSLKGCPKWIGNYFHCGNNRLTSLEFSPDYVGGEFYCAYNDLTDNYCDTEIGGYFYTNQGQKGLSFFKFKAVNYKEWQKIKRRKLILDKIFN